MFVYPSGVDVSGTALRFLSARLRARRRAIGTRWRRLSAGREALLVLVHLPNRHTYPQLAAGFGVGITTVYRYVIEAVELLGALAPLLAEAVRAALLKAYLILDGTLMAIDRIAADRHFYSGRHKMHGMNVQVIADPKGRLLWASPALPGAVHDVRAAREHGIVDALAAAGITCRADKGYHGDDGTIRIPCHGRWDSLSTAQQAVNRSHAKIRALVEQAVATLKTWRLLRKLRCSTTRITSLVLWGSGLRGTPGEDRLVEFGYDDLRALLAVTRTAFVECTGNGRSYYTTQQDETVSGTAWTLGAIGVARWRGVR